MTSAPTSPSFAGVEEWKPIATADRYKHPSLDLYDPAHAGEYGASWDGYWDDDGQCWRAAVWCNSCTTWHDTKVDPTHWRLRPGAPDKAGIPAGMKPWHGGGSAPADWDGDSFCLRDGTILVGAEAKEWGARFGNLQWPHDKIESLGDIIAYTPKAPPQTPPDAGIGSDGAGLEVAAQLAYRICAETRHVTLGDKIADAIRALATHPGDGGRS